MEEVIAEFLVESHENLDQLDRDLITLEDRPDARDVLAGIFRTIHTIKGTCGFLGFGKLESVAHVGENLLSKLRDGKLRVNSDIVSGLLAMVDAVREILKNIETSGAEGDGDYSSIIANLTRLPNEEAGPAPAQAVTTAPAEAATVESRVEPVEESEHAAEDHSQETPAVAAHAKSSEHASKHPETTANPADP